MDRLLIARFDPAVVLLSRWGGAAVLNRQPGGARTEFWPHVGPRSVAVADSRPVGNLPALGGPASDELHIRGHADANRVGLHLPVSSRILLPAGAVFGCGGHPRGLLGRVRP